LLRGAVAISLLVWAIRHQAQPTMSIAAGIGAFFAFRGCPICWTIGLIKTISHKVKQLT
jgi:hypothetical protein